jgi:hypothetical protein
VLCFAARVRNLGRILAVKSCSAPENGVNMGVAAKTARFAAVLGLVTLPRRYQAGCFCAGNIRPHHYIGSLIGLAACGRSVLDQPGYRPGRTGDGGPPRLPS